ncbi:MAG TPA: acyl carrier protein phosphodiesterase, partial [Flavobacteriales bacterium]|nr:acyl carrier protein phosphodiesterase [Flavobacteriales bacterium]
DGHALQQRGRERAHAHAGRYASVVMDIYYDHVLASNWSDFHPEPLPAFTRRMYALLTRYQHLMPEHTQRMLPYMVQGDWLTSYATIGGIGRALAGLARRVPKGASMVGAEIVLQENLAEYTAEFRRFLSDLTAHVAQLR